MAVKSLRKICAEMPDWLSPEEVSSTLEEVFAAADDGEDPVAVANGIMEVMVRAAENDRWLSDAEQVKTLEWLTLNWADEPPAYFSRLCALTSNLKLDGARGLLEEKQGAEKDPGRRERIQRILDDLAAGASEDGE